MKKVIKLLSIGLMTILLSLNATSSFSQNKEKTIKEGAVYIGNVMNPQQIAAYGTPAWLFSTMCVSFVQKQCLLTFNNCVYSINRYTGGLGEAMHSETSEAIPASYVVKNGKVYVWDPDEGSPKEDSDYTFIFDIEEEGLSLVQSLEKSIKTGKYVYMADYNKMKKMSEEQLQQVEVVALSKLLKSR